MAVSLHVVLASKLAIMDNRVRGINCAAGGEKTSPLWEVFFPVIAIIIPTFITFQA